MSLVNVESFRTRVIDGMKPGDDLALMRWVTVLEAMALENVTWAAEDRLADNLRTEAADPNNGWRENETYRASKIHAALKERARELRGGTHD